MKNQEVKYKDFSGITLIALVVTIIVLLILAGISIMMLSGNNGILNRAGEAKDKTIIGEEKEQVEISYMAAVMNKLGENVNDTDLQKELDSNVGENKTIVTDNYDDTLNVLFYETKHNYTVKDKNISYMGIIPDTPENTVARINTTFYPSLQEAIDAVTDNKKTNIFLLKDISENVTVNNEKKIILNLEKHTIKNNENTPIVTLDGFLYVRNGNLQGNFNTNVASILVNSEAEINLSNTNVGRESNVDNKKETIELHGNLKIDSGKIENTSSFAIRSYTDSNVNIEISGTAEINSNNTSTIFTAGGVNTKITGGKVKCINNVAINNSGTVTISDAEIISGAPDGYGTIYNNGILNINSGKIEDTNAGYAVYNLSKATAIINNGELSTLNSNAIHNAGKMEINEGAYIHNSGGSRWNNSTIFNNGNTAILKLNGGKIENKNNRKCYI